MQIILKKEKTELACDDLINNIHSVAKTFVHVTDTGMEFKILLVNKDNDLK